MDDFYEIDFLSVETRKSGDAIALRYKVNGVTSVHVVDGGFAETGSRLVEHINGYYGTSFIDHVVLTHPDGDHAGGLCEVLNSFEVGCLWMNRPWMYASEIIHRFSRYTNVDNLIRDLKRAYPYAAELEKIAGQRGIVIREAFQGQHIGAFTVAAPTRNRYLDKIVESEKTGQVAKLVGLLTEPTLGGLFAQAASAVTAFFKSAWGGEAFPPDGTSAENEMSIVQFAKLCDHSILLTGDTGREGLQEFVGYAPWLGVLLPGISRFQVPHHGSRHNVSTELLDKILGPRLPAILPEGQKKFFAIISSAKEDPDHPRKAVVRAMHHRGAAVYSTEGRPLQVHQNGPTRGWSSASCLDYPDDQEEV